MECETGCIHVTGGEVKHHRDCQFYSGSYSEMLDRALARVEKLEKAIREHHELWRNSHGVCFVECKIVCKALTEDDKEAE